jgi:tRNA threonylcarbamoyladenosine biosynthesis protein TsaE
MLLTATAIDQLADIASQILSFSSNNRSFLFYGDMGAGKTTLIKSLCHHLGSNDNVTSPTFSIVNEYIGRESNIYHFDFYRLKTQTEALDMGFEEYLYSGNYCFIEWPERIPDLLPLHYINIKIEVAADNARHIKLEQI